MTSDREGFAWIGIEREREYCQIAEARLQGVQRGLGLDVAAPTPAMPKQTDDIRSERLRGDRDRARARVLPDCGSPPARCPTGLRTGRGRPDTGHAKAD